MASLTLSEQQEILENAKIRLVDKAAKSYRETLARELKKLAKGPERQVTGSIGKKAL